MIKRYAFIDQKMPHLQRLYHEGSVPDLRAKDGRSSSAEVFTGGPVPEVQDKFRGGT
jgi:hypothetical protein